MRITIITIISIILANSLVQAQSTCSTFYPFTKGTISQITTYNKRGKVTAITDYKILEVSHSERSEIATVEMSIGDKKGKSISETTYDMICNNNQVSIEIESLMNNQLFDQFKDFDIQLIGNDIIVPNDLKTGMNLPDASIIIQVDMSGIVMNMSIDMIDRVINGKEKITTPAGTFDCFVISYISNLKMGMSKSIKSKQWIAEGVGLVKQEDYSKKGKVKTSSLLTSFTK